MAARKRAPRKGEGRPRVYDRKACLLKICDEMAKGDRCLEDICKSDDELPHHGVIYTWLDDPELNDIFTRAQRLWCWAQRDLIVKISDDDSRDMIERTVEHIGKDGEVKKIESGQTSDNTAVNRDKLRINTRQWAMAKLVPKLFGDKVEQEINQKIEHRHLVDVPAEETRAQWEARVRAAMQEATPAEVVDAKEGVQGEAKDGVDSSTGPAS